MGEDDESTISSEDEWVGIPNEDGNAEEESVDEEDKEGDKEVGEEKKDKEEEESEISETEIINFSKGNPEDRSTFIVKRRVAKMPASL